MTTPAKIVWNQWREKRRRERGHLSIDPLLITLHSVTRIDHDELPGIINAALVSANLSVFTEHPVLQPSIEKLTDIKPSITTITAKTTTTTDPTYKQTGLKRQQRRRRRVRGRPTWLPPWLWHGHSFTGLLWAFLSTALSTHAGCWLPLKLPGALLRICPHNRKISIKHLYNQIHLSSYTTQLHTPLQ